MRKTVTLGQLFAGATIAIAIVVVAAFTLFVRESHRSILVAAQRQQELVAGRVEARVVRELGRAERVLENVERAIHAGAVSVDEPLALETALFTRIIDDEHLEEVTFTRADLLEVRPGRSAARSRGSLAALGVSELERRRRHEEHAPRGRRPLRRARRAIGARTPRSRRRPSGPTAPPRIRRRTRRSRWQPRRAFVERAIWSDLHWSELDHAVPQRERRVVVSVQKAIEDRAGHFLGVVRVGLVTNELDAIARVQSAPGDAEDVQRIALLATAPKHGTPRLVARIDPSDRMVTEDDEIRVASDRPPPEIRDLLRSPIVRGLDRAHPNAAGLLVVDGEPWLATLREIDLGEGGTSGWMVAVLAPESRYTAEFVAFERQFMSAFAITIGVLLAIGAATVIALRRGLSRVTTATTRMRTFDFAPVSDKSRIKDIDEVMHGLERAKTVVRAMGKFVPIDLVRRLYESNEEPELGGEMLDVALMFTDIEGFTTLAEKLPPDVLAKRLGDYLAAMTTAIEATGGTIDKYIGDAVMAIWNAPTRVPHYGVHACRATLACMKATKELYASSAWSGLPALDDALRPPRGARDGRQLRSAHAAHLHGARRRREPGGAARAALQAVRRGHARERSDRADSAKDEFVFRRIDRVAVKGKTAGIDVYELLGAKGDDIDELPRARRYEEAFDAYLARDFERAIRLHRAADRRGPPQRGPRRAMPPPRRASSARRVDGRARRGVEVSKRASHQSSGSAVVSLREHVIDGERAGTEDGDHHEDEEVRRLLEPDEIEEAVDVAALRGEDRDDHAHDERDRREPREEPDHERRAAQELAPTDHHRVQAGRRDVQGREELRHLLDVVDLAPPRRQKDEPDREPAEQQRDAFQPREGGHRLVTNDEHVVCDSLRHVAILSPHRAKALLLSTILNNERGNERYVRLRPSRALLAIGVLLSLGAASSCGAASSTAATAPRPQERLAPSPATSGADGAVAWSYEIAVDAALDLDVRATFHGPIDVPLVVDPAATRFVTAVEVEEPTGWRKTDLGDARWASACASTCTLRYHFRLRDAAKALGDVDVAILSGGAIFAPPSTWLARPRSAGAASRASYRFHVVTPPGVRFATGIRAASGAARAGAGAVQGTYEAPIASLEEAAFAGFGALRVGHLADPGIERAIAPDVSFSDDVVTHWLKAEVDAVTSYFGHAPDDYAMLFIAPGTSDDTGGKTLGGGGASLLVRLGKNVKARDLDDDWVVAHELIHVAFPDLDRRYTWFSEGLATYAEPIARERMGLVKREKVWAEMLEGFPQGLPGPNDGGLDGTREWGRTYWGGALYFFLADVRIRERTNGAKSLEDALHAVVATGGNVEGMWPLARVLDIGDAATGTNVLHELYDELGPKRGNVDLDAVLRRLGVRLDGHVVRFDDRAPLAAARDAILPALPKK